MNNIIKYVNTDNLTDDVYCIIDSAQKLAYHSVNITLVLQLAAGKTNIGGRVKGK